MQGPNASSGGVLHRLAPPALPASLQVTQSPPTPLTPPTLPEEEVVARAAVEEGAIQAVTPVVEEVVEEEVEDPTSMGRRLAEKLGNT